LRLAAGPRARVFEVSLAASTWRPEIAQDAELAVVFDGSLHDRTGLEATLDDQHLSRTMTDAELIMNAYRSVGRDVVGRVRGDFTLLIWDGKHDALLAARDPFGSYPLFYAQRNGGLVLSPSPEVLVGSGAASSALNELALAAWIIGGAGLLNVSETFYLDVCRLPPGNLLETENSGRLRISRYWNPRPVHAGEPWNPDEAHEEFDGLLRQAVRRRLGEGPVAILLSGGVDSASVAAVAAEESRAAGLPDPLALSMRFAHPDSDEAQVQRAVARDIGISQVMMTLEEAVGGQGTLSAGLAMSERSWLPPGNPWGANFDALVVAAQERGCSAVLSGEGGNHWLELDWSDGADFLWRLELPRFRRFLRATHRYGRRSTRWELRMLLWQHGIRRAVCRMLSRFDPASVARRLSIRHERRLPPWALPDASLRRSFADRQAARSPCVTRLRRTWREELLGGSEMPILLESLFLTSRRLATPLPNPYFDVELVEFLYGAPVDILLYRGCSKGLAQASYRQRVSGTSPGMLGGRSFDGDLQILLEHEGPGAVGRLKGVPLLARLGLVDRRRVETILRDRCVSPEMGYYQAWQVLASEAWLRSRARGSYVGGESHCDPTGVGC
jgi:asparagine synthase (glutamine-hydrolysing)